MLITKEFKNFYRVKRGEILFHAMTRGDYSGRYFKELKKSRNFDRIETDKIMISCINCAAHFIKKNKFNIITTPPDSGCGRSFAGEVAKAISTECGVDFVKIFEDHNQGKRLYTKSKFQTKIDYNPIKKIKGERIIIFDDFTETNITMVAAIEALFRKNQVAGLVLWIH